jgi:hypothetical protein
MPTQREINIPQTLIQDDELLMLYLQATEAEQNVDHLMSDEDMIKEQELLFLKISNSKSQEEKKRIPAIRGNLDGRDEGRSYQARGSQELAHTGRINY